MSDEIRCSHVRPSELHSYQVESLLWDLDIGNLISPWNQVRRVRVKDEKDTDDGDQALKCHRPFSLCLTPNVTHDGL